MHVMCETPGCERTPKGRQRFCPACTTRRWRERQPKTPCAVDGCDTIAKSDGLCPKHYARRWRHGSTDATAIAFDPLDRLSRFVDVGASGLSCWTWTGEIDASTGYGRCASSDLGTRWAHRWVYLLLVGPIPEQLDHLCRNKACVNPDHLEPVDQGTNQGRAQDVRWLGTCPRNLHDLTSMRIRRGHRECAACVAAYNATR